MSLIQYPNSPYSNNQQDTAGVVENTHGETHRAGNIASANNVYMNVVQPDYNTMNNNIRNRIRDAEQETSQPGYYSHGDYGWKMGDKRPHYSQENYPSGNFKDISLWGHNLIMHLSVK